VIEIKIFKLRFKTPLHIGADSTLREKVDTIIHSDTLYSALYDLAVRARSKIKDAISRREILLTSAFPYYEDGSEKIFFLPKPIFNFKIYGYDPKWDFELGKKLKKLTFVPSTWLESSDFIKEFLKNEISKKPDYLRETYAIDILPRVFVDRVTSSSNFYRMAQVFFHKGGLYFGVKFLSDGLEDEFRGLLKLLGDEGIGGRRSTGSGAFEFEEDKLVIKVPQGANFYLLLSLAVPSEDEMDNILKESSYELILRRGWFLLNTGHSLRRKSIWMFKEGSVLRKEIKGCAIDVTPDALSEYVHAANSEVYKFAYAFTIPVGLSHE